MMVEERFNKSEINRKIKEGFIGQRIFVMPRPIIKIVKKSSLTRSLYLTNIGYFPHARNHFIKREAGSSTHILLYCIKGQGIITLGEEEIILEPNEFYIIPANEPHEYKANEKNPWTIYWFHFSGKTSTPFCEKFFDLSGYKKMSISFNERRILLFENIMNVLEKGYSIKSLEYTNVTLWQLLSSFIFYENFDEIGNSEHENELVNKAISYVMQNLDSSLSINDITKKLNYSHSHFLKLFKRKTGFSPIQYFNHMKIQKACQYLSFTDMSVKEICFILGYNDPLYFSRLFKKTLGVSPTEYREKNTR